MSVDAGRIALAAEDVHVWLTDYASVSDARLTEAYRRLLNDEERAQQLRFHFEHDRQRYLVTRALVRTVLSRYAAVDPQEWIFSTNAYGRPEPANEEAEAIGLTFNLSHTHSLIAMVVARHRAAGIDVENVRRRQAPIDVADHYFAPAEVKALHALPESDRQLRFFEYWTFKESYIKTRGMGLSLPLDQFAFHFPSDDAVALTIDPELGDDPARWEFRQFRPSDEYVTALCLERMPSLRSRIVVRRAVPLSSESFVSPEFSRCTFRPRSEAFHA